MILRGVTLRRKREMTESKMGANWLFPEAWDAFTLIPPAERHDLPQAYYVRLTDPIRPCAEPRRAWGAWESAIEPRSDAQFCR
jgi:hypothetical protein